MRNVSGRGVSIPAGAFCKNSQKAKKQIFFNGNKVSEIQINGDGQKIKIPPMLIRKNQVNEVTIKTGRNLMQTAYIDYDDIEFMNIFFEN